MTTKIILCIITIMLVIHVNIIQYICITEKQKIKLKN